MSISGTSKELPVSSYRAYQIGHYGLVVVVFAGGVAGFGFSDLASSKCSSTGEGGVADHSRGFELRGISKVNQTLTRGVGALAYIEGPQATARSWLWRSVLAPLVWHSELQLIFTTR